MLLAAVAPSAVPAQTPAAAPFVAGTRTVVAVDFSTPGTLPAGIRFIQGAPAWGERDGVAMLKATTSTTLELTLPEILPPHFTIEADFFSSSGSAQKQFAVAATATLVGTTRSALLVWHHHYTGVLRGGAAAGDKYFYPSPALLPELQKQLVHIQVVMNGDHFSIFTNDELIGDYPNLAVRRTNVLLVYLGGEPRPGGEVYLAKLRIGSNSGATGVAANPSIPAVTRPASPGALGAEPAPRAPDPAPPGPPASGGTSSSLNESRTVTLAGFTAAGVFVSIAPRTITLFGFTAAGSFTGIAQRSITMSGFTAAGSFSGLAPRTITLRGWTGVGQTSKP